MGIASRFEAQQIHMIHLRSSNGKPVSVVNTMPCTAPVFGSCVSGKGGAAKQPDRDRQLRKALCQHNSFGRVEPAQLDFLLI